MAELVARTSPDMLRTPRVVRREPAWTGKSGHPSSPLGEGGPLSGHIVRPPQLMNHLLHAGVTMAFNNRFDARRLGTQLAAAAAFGEVKASAAWCKQPANALSASSAHYLPGNGWSRTAPSFSVSKRASAS